MALGDFFDFSELPMEKQIAFGMLLPFIPVIIGETLFFYLIIFAGMGILTSFSVSLSFTAFGLTLWYMWRDGVRKEIMDYEPINATMRWNKEVVTWENQMITGRVALKNEATIRPVELTEEQLPRFKKPPLYKKEVLFYSKKEEGYIRREIDVAFTPAKMDIGLFEFTVGNPELVENLLAGTKTTEVHLHHNSFAPNGIPFRKVQFIHFFPYQEDFYPCPDQFVVHQAQVLGGSSSVVDATFLYWGERGEPIPVFLVLSSPMVADLVQMSIGIKALFKDVEGKTDLDAMETYGKELRWNIKDAVELGDANQSIILSQLLRTRTNALQAMSEGRKDVEDLAYSIFADWDANEKEIEDIKPWIDLSNWKHIAVIMGIAFIASLGIYWLWMR